MSESFPFAQSTGSTNLDDGWIQLRDFTVADAAALADFWKEREFDIPGGLYHDVPAIDSEFVLRTLRESKTVRATVAIRKGRIVGYIQIRQWDSVLYVCSFYIDPEMRGGALGARVLFVPLQFLTTLPSGTCQRMFGSFSPSNQVARRLYRRFGFVEPRPGEVEALTPKLLALVPFARFAQRNDLFRSHKSYLRAVSLDAVGVRRIEPAAGQRDWSVRFEWERIPVFPQRFCVGNDWIEFLVDAASMEVCHMACPEWSASLVPCYRLGEGGQAPDFTVRITNFCPTPLTVDLAKKIECNILERGETLEVAAALRMDAQRNIAFSAEIGGTPITLGLCVPNKTGHRHQPVEIREVGGRKTFVLETQSSSAVGDYSLGGSVRSLEVAGEQILQTASELSSLGWILPWKGGMFSVLEDACSDYRLEPWGSFPFHFGFNTTPVRCWRDGQRVFRESSRGCLSENCLFALESDGMRIESCATNHSNQPLEGSFALFVFLRQTAGDEIVAYSAEGESKRGSRRSFTLESKKSVAIEIQHRVISFEVTKGTAAVRAFNLGDDGIHLALVSNFSLTDQRATSTIAAKLRVGLPEP